MPVETGECRVVADRLSPKIRPRVKRKKQRFRKGLFCAEFPALPGGLLCNQQEISMHNNLVRPTSYAERHRGRTEHLSAALPFISDWKNGTSYAPWQVWSGSTTTEARFVPIPRKAAVRLYYKALEWNRRGKLAGCHGGLIGSHVLLVLHSLIFDFLNHRTGRLDPSYNALQRTTRLCRQTVAKALARLKQLGIINWIRRCTEDRDDCGRFVLRQETNAYAILPTTQWRDYADTDAPEPPHPSAWGACPPLPAIIERATTAREEGGSMAAIVARLDDDPRDTLASALASLGRALGL